MNYPSRVSLLTRFAARGLLTLMIANGAIHAQNTSDETDASEIEDKTITLSPFTVNGTTRGYQATTTMSGTRLNSKLEDLGAAISVVTAEQMADFAMLDINDVFDQEVSTEGTGNYSDVEVDRRGNIIDNVQDNPQGANRVRGMGAANVTLNNFVTTGRIPVDPLDIEALEINRGPNSSIFGIGSGAGSVNMIATSALLGKEMTKVTLRVDDVGGWRTSFDASRPLIEDKLALRISAAWQHDDFRQKPSGFDSKRYNIMLRAQPFKNTSVQASFRSYYGEGNRPNSGTPRDSVSYWRSVGSPTWDPVTSTVTVNGVSTFMGNTDPLGLGHTGAVSGQPPALFVGPDGVGLWMIGRVPLANAVNGPNNQGGQQRLLEALPEPLNEARPLFATLQGVNDKSIYDWTSINLAAPNYIEDRVNTSMFQIEQFLIDTPRHKVAIEGAFYREEAERLNYNTVNAQAGTGNSGILNIDVNERLLDGSPNPYFLAPYIGVVEGKIRDQPFEREISRAQLAYIADFSENDGWSKWLGRHSLLGYTEYREDKNYNYSYRQANVSMPGNPIYVAPGEQRGWGLTNSGLRTYDHFYVGDGQGQNVDFAPGSIALGQYPFRWFNPQTNQWVTDTAELGLAGYTRDAGGNRTLIKSFGGVMQNAFWDNRLIFTLGARKDELWNKSYNAPILDASGLDYDRGATQQVQADDEWFSTSGNTLTKGVVIKPLSWLHFHYNESDTFQPLQPAFNLAFEVLGSPTTEGSDYGFSLYFFDHKLVVKANHYKVTARNLRDGENSTIASRFLRLDGVIQNDSNGLLRQATAWVTQANPSWTSDQIETEVLRQIDYTQEQLDLMDSFTRTETTDVVSEGDEIEVYYNPNDYWTTKINIARSESYNSGISRGTSAYIAARLPLWTTIVDPRTNQLWWTTRYGNRISKNIYDSNLAIVKLAQATEGLARPQVREWRANLSTRYRLAGLFDHKHLSQMSVGASVRWEDQGAIGYYGVPVNGDITAATEFDADRPIWSPANTYVDAFVTYKLKLFSDKVRARLQLNVRNLFEDGGLRAIGAFPDGQSHTYRIIDPRKFIFSASFDM